MTYRALLALGLLALTLTGCNFAKVNKEATEAIQNLNAEAMRVKNTVETTVKELNEATQSINDAAGSIGEAIDAVGNASNEIGDLPNAVSGSNDDADETESSPTE